MTTTRQLYEREARERKLNGPAADLYVAWRGAARTVTQALEEVRRSGLLSGSTVTSISESASRASGLGGARKLTEAEKDAVIAKAFGRTPAPAAVPAPQEVTEAEMDAAVAGAFGRKPATQQQEMSWDEAMTVAGDPFTAENRHKYSREQVAEARRVVDRTIVEGR